AGKTWLAVAGVARRRRTAFGAAAHGKSLDQLAIEPNVELLRPTHSLQVILVLPLKTYFDGVLAVDRKVVMDGHPAARPERQIFPLAVLLKNVQRNLKSLDFRERRRQAGGQTRHLASD